eukprot:JP446956.1.p1 GENE.JP446956.1~~JP446956.1.p1  ORF type:complete len:236 (-),score=46.32 JP446956.1:36-743(-)
MRSLPLLVCLALFGAVCAQGYHLRYFAVRGLGESIRLLLEDQKLDFVETRFALGTDEWKEAKPLLQANNTIRFGQVPQLTNPDGLSIVQSKAIMRHLGRTLGLYGASEEEHVLADEITDHADDIRKSYYNTLYGKSYTVSDKKKLLETAATKFGQLEALLKDKQYFLGTISFVDYIVWDLFDTLTSWDSEVSPASATPNLHAFHKNMAQRGNLAAYLSSDRRLPFRAPAEPSADE